MNPFILNQTIASTVRYPCAEKAKPVESSDILSGMRFDDMNDNLSNVNADLQSLAQGSQGRWRLSACGVTAGLRSIPALVAVDAYAAETGRRRIALVSGLSGNVEDAALGLRALQWAAGAHHPYAGNVALTGVPLANPEGRTDLSAAFPPQGNFFYDADAPETRYLWRWLCFQAPDLALEIRTGNTVEWRANAAAGELGPALGAPGVVLDESSLVAALGRGTPDNLGPIPGLRLTTPDGLLEGELERLWNIVGSQPGSLGASAARNTLGARRRRSFLELGGVLAGVYGYALDPVNYTQGVAISGRLRLAQLEPSGESPVEGIVRLLEPYVSGAIPMFGDRPSGANLAGLLWGQELAEATGDRRYSDLIVQVADRYQAVPRGTAPPPCDPDFRTEDMFMAGAMLGRAFSITGERNYLDILTRFLLDGEIQQDDGLFRHCRSAPYFWGRGNGFAALGLTETLTYLPEDHPDRGAVLAMYRRLLEGMRNVQEPSGMYPEVLDFPGSYHEFTATCMAGYAMARGLRRGWLDESYRESLRMAWQGVSERVDDNGDVVDACISTGVQENLRDYLHRPAVFGFDDRSGSMALWFAVEMERLSRG